MQEKPKEGRIGFGRKKETGPNKKQMQTILKIMYLFPSNLEEVFSLEGFGEALVKSFRLENEAKQRKKKRYKP